MRLSKLLSPPPSLRVTSQLCHSNVSRPNSALGRGGIRDPVPRCVALANQRLRPLGYRGSTHSHVCLHSLASSLIHSLSHSLTHFLTRSFTDSLLGHSLVLSHSLTRTHCSHSVSPSALTLEPSVSYEADTSRMQVPSVVSGKRPSWAR